MKMLFFSTTFSAWKEKKCDHMILHRTKNLGIKNVLFYCLYPSVVLCVLFQRFIFMQSREGFNIVHNAVKP